jgi:hypothetical protein
MKAKLQPPFSPFAGAPRQRWRARITARLHWIAIALWASAFLAALVPLLGL